LKAPWGMEIAPANFGATLAGKLWVGNFGDGPINVFDPDSGAVFYTVRDTHGEPIVIDGVWGLLVCSGSPPGGRGGTHLLPRRPEQGAARFVREPVSQPLTAAGLDQDNFTSR